MVVAIDAVDGQSAPRDPKLPWRPHSAQRLSFPDDVGVLLFGSVGHELNMLQTDQAIRVVTHQLGYPGRPVWTSTV